MAEIGAAGGAWEELVRLDPEAALAAARALGRSELAPMRAQAMELGMSALEAQKGALSEAAAAFGAWAMSGPIEEALAAARRAMAMRKEPSEALRGEMARRLAPERCVEIERECAGFAASFPAGWLAREAEPAAAAFAKEGMLGPQALLSAMMEGCLEGAKRAASARKGSAGPLPGEALWKAAVGRDPSLLSKWWGLGEGGALEDSRRLRALAFPSCGDPYGPWGKPEDLGQAGRELLIAACKATQQYGSPQAARALGRFLGKAGKEFADAFYAAHSSRLAEPAVSAGDLSVKLAPMNHEARMMCALAWPKSPSGAYAKALAEFCEGLAESQQAAPKFLAKGDGLAQGSAFGRYVALRMGPLLCLDGAGGVSVGSLASWRRAALESKGEAQALREWFERALSGAKGAGAKGGQADEDGEREIGRLARARALLEAAEIGAGAKEPLLDPRRAAPRI